MKKIFWCLWFLCSVLLHVTTFAQNSRINIQPEASWITVSNDTYIPAKDLEADAEDGYLDLRFEKQVSFSENSRYYKKAIQILSDAGVQNSSEISVDYDPDYEQLIFHRINIIRDGKTINKLSAKKFKIIQQEKDLEAHLYDGSLTALLVLDDVRKGDVIESSYTIKGFNPIFNNKHSTLFYLNYATPIASLYYKLAVPSGTNIYLKSKNTDITPQKRSIGVQDIYEWKAERVPALHVEAKVPDWFDPYGRVMITEYKNWNEVSRWASGLFVKNLPLSPALAAKIKSIKDESTTNEECVLNALYFVQDDIRYMGIEMGVNSHKPGNPNKIFNQRFGDCKDKSYLLVTMLNAMGIEANPVLINTTYKGMLNETLPNASSFDHCTVQVKIDNKTYWFDPTIQFQRGSIDNISYPDYQLGLVVSDATTGLETIPFNQKGLADVKEYFEIPDMSGVAYFKVVTNYSGFLADDTRSAFSNNSLYQMKNKYKDFYAFYFDKITADSLTYNNDDSSGIFTTTEYYTLKDVWKKEGPVKKFSVSSYVINSVMSQPSDKNRSMPFSLIFPANYKENIEVTLPEDWPVNNFSDNISCAGFNYTGISSSSKNVISLNYRYESLKDNVTPGEAEDFFERYKEVSNSTGFELTFNGGKNSTLNSSARGSAGSGQDIFSRLYVLLGLAVLITYLVKRNKRSRY